MPVKVIPLNLKTPIEPSSTMEAWGFNQKPGNLPSNALKRPISELIEELQRLPPGTTYENLYDENVFYGGQTSNSNLGTSYKLVFDICEGLVTK